MRNKLNGDNKMTTITEQFNNTLYSENDIKSAINLLEDGELLAQLEKSDKYDDKKEECEYLYDIATEMKKKVDYWLEAISDTDDYEDMSEDDIRAYIDNTYDENFIKFCKECNYKDLSYMLDDSDFESVKDCVVNYK